MCILLARPWPKWPTSPGLGEHYDKLDVEPRYLSRGGTALRLSLIYGEHDGQRREEFVLRRVRAGRLRIPFGAGTSLDTRCYVGDVAARRGGRGLFRRRP